MSHTEKYLLLRNVHSHIYRKPLKSLRYSIIIVNVPHLSRAPCNSQLTHSFLPTIARNGQLLALCLIKNTPPLWCVIDTAVVEMMMETLHIHKWMGKYGLPLKAHFVRMDYIIFNISVDGQYINHIWHSSAKMTN